MDIGLYQQTQQDARIVQWSDSGRAIIESRPIDASLESLSFTSAHSESPQFVTAGWIGSEAVSPKTLLLICFSCFLYP